MKKIIISLVGLISLALFVLLAKQYNGSDLGQYKTEIEEPPSAKPVTSTHEDSPYMLAVEIESGLLSINRDGGELAILNFVGWDDGWQWDPPVLKKVHDDNHKQFKFAQQDVDLMVSSKESTNGFEYTLALDFLKSDDNTIGGAIDFLAPNVEKIVANGGGRPQLLADNRGWSWQLSNSSKVVVEFAPPLPNIQVLFGNSGQIRAWLFDEKIAVGG